MLLRRGIVRLVPFLAALCVGVLVTPPAWAGIIQYDFSSDATMTVRFTTLSISGFFDFNTTTPSASTADITFKSGGTTETFTNVQSSIPLFCFTSTDMICVKSGGSDFFSEAFTNSLALDAVDPLALAGAGLFEATGCACDAFGSLVDTLASAVTGSAIPVPAVPEPASVAIFGAGLAVLGVMRRKRKAR
jgi:hypothetical protein